MKVKELIEELEKVEDKELDVAVEGCDCYGKATKVSQRQEPGGIFDDPFILIERE